MAGKILVAIMALILFFGGLLGLMETGIIDLRTESVTQTSVETTAPGVTTADMVLTHDLFRDDVTYIVTVTSSIAETPAATAFDPETDTLTVSALTEDATRTLTIRYKMEREDVIMQVLGPFLLVLLVGGVLAALFWDVWSSRKRRY